MDGGKDLTETSSTQRLEHLRGHINEWALFLVCSLNKANNAS